MEFFLQHHQLSDFGSHRENEGGPRQARRREEDKVETGRNNEGEMMQSAERQTKREIREEKKKDTKKKRGRESENR